MLLDNLSVHRSHVVRDWAENRGMHLLFNAPYSCQFNPIEWLWGFAKHEFYRDIMLVEKKLTFTAVEARVRHFIEAVSTLKVKNSIDHVMRSAEQFQIAQIP